MKRTAIGRTGVTVTAAGFGSAPIGNLYSAVDPDTAHAAVRAAWDTGVRYFDTAPHYGLGLAERRLGAALAGLPRAEYTVSTKVGRLLVPNPEPTGSDRAEGFDVPDTSTRVRDYSRDGVLRSLEASLERLGLDRIDIVLVHDPEDHLRQAVTETIPALLRLRDQGVIGAVGAGMNLWAPLRRIVRETPVDVVMIAGRWTLLDRSAGPLLDDCQARDVAVLAAAPYNSGLLAHPWPPEDTTFDYGPASAELLAEARRCARVCRAHGTTLPAAALRFPLRHPAVAAVVTGMRDAGQARANAEHLRTPVPPGAWPELDPR